MQPLLSIVIPAYNAEKYISETIDSIVNQTDKSFELIIVDNASTDETGHIIEEYREKHPQNISIYRIEKNEGPAKARNYGLTNATGKYFLSADADDLLEVDFVENLKKYEELDIDAFTYGYNEIDPNNKIIKSYNPPKDECWAKWGIMTAWKYVVKTDILRMNSIEFPKGYYEDTIFCTRSLQKVKTFKVIRKRLYSYRIHPNSTVRKFHTQLDMYPDSRENVFKTISEAYCDVEPFEKKYLMYKALIIYYGILLKYFRGESLDALKQEYTLHTMELTKYFPDYKKIRLSISFPKGEVLFKRLAVAISHFLDKHGLFVKLYYQINKGEK